MIEIPARFWAKVDRTGDCWLWTGAKSSDGYGSFRLDGHSVCAHRVAYAGERGEISSDVVLDHLCRTRACVRPEHLRETTDRGNILAPGSLALAKIAAERLSCAAGHPYTAENTRLTRRGRICRSCDRRRHRELRDRRVALVPA